MAVQFRTVTTKLPPGLDGALPTDVRTAQLVVQEIPVVVPDTEADAPVDVHAERNQRDGRFLVAEAGEKIRKQLEAPAETPAPGPKVTTALGPTADAALTAAQIEELTKIAAQLGIKVGGTPPDLMNDPVALEALMKKLPTPAGQDALTAAGLEDWDIERLMGILGIKVADANRRAAERKALAARTPQYSSPSPTAPTANPAPSMASAPSSGGAASSGGGGPARAGGAPGGAGATTPTGAAAAGAKVKPVDIKLSGDDQKVAEAINQYMKDNGAHPDLHGLGPQIVDIAKKSGIDPFLIVAIGKHETGLGQLGVGPLKWLGIAAFDWNPDGASVHDGPQAQLQAFVKTYLGNLEDGGGNLQMTIADQLAAVNKGWATDANWHAGVGGMYGEVRQAAGVA